MDVRLLAAGVAIVARRAASAIEASPLVRMAVGAASPAWARPRARAGRPSPHRRRFKLAHRAPPCHHIAAQWRRPSGDASQRAMTGASASSAAPSTRPIAAIAGLSLAAMRALGLDEVWWLVSPGNPLKPAAGMAPYRSAARLGPRAGSPRADPGQRFRARRRARATPSTRCACCSAPLSRTTASSG